MYEIRTEITVPVIITYTSEFESASCCTNEGFKNELEDIVIVDDYYHSSIKKYLSKSIIEKVIKIIEEDIDEMKLSAKIERAEREIL